MVVNTAVIKAECAKYMPFLLTTTIMMNAVKKGLGREDAHEIIKEHAVATANDLRAGKISENDLLKRLADDPRMPLDASELGEINRVGSAATGMAEAQTLDSANARSDGRQNARKQLTTSLHQSYKVFLSDAARLRREIRCARAKTTICRCLKY